jgi:hypothetical protein
LSADSRSRTAPPQDRAGERSFPLIAVFYLATFWAATATCIDGAALARQLRQPWELNWTAAIIAGALSIAVLFGAAVGLGQLRMWRSAALGAVMGALFGLTMLAVYAAPAPIGRGISAAVVLTVTTLALRFRAA